MRRKLFWHLVPSHLAVLIATVLAVGGYAALTLRRSHIEQVRDGLEARAGLLRDSVRRRIETGDWSSLDAFCKEAGAAGRTRLTVVLPGGRVAADSEEDPARMESHGDRPEVFEALAGKVGTAERFSSTLSADLLYVAVPIEGDGKVRGALRVSIPLTPVSRSLGSLTLRIAVAGAVAALLAAAAILELARRIARPVEEMKEGAERFASGDLSTPAPAPAVLEFAELAGALNRMASALDERIRTATLKKNEQEAVDRKSVV
jgi:two-component system phosphate regulon sensor histidine kinase PhoR